MQGMLLPFLVLLLHCSLQVSPLMCLEVLLLVQFVLLVVLFQPVEMAWQLQQVPLVFVLLLWLLVWAQAVRQVQQKEREHSPVLLLLVLLLLVRLLRLLLLLLLVLLLFVLVALLVLLLVVLCAAVACAKEQQLKGNQSVWLAQQQVHQGHPIHDLMMRAQWWGRACLVCLWGRHLCVSSSSVTGAAVVAVSTAAVTVAVVAVVETAAVGVGLSHLAAASDCCHLHDVAAVLVLVLVETHQLLVPLWV